MTSETSDPKESYRGPGRLRVSGSLARLATEAAIKKRLPKPSKPNTLTGRIIEKSRVESHLGYLKSIAGLKELKPTRVNTWRSLLSGEIPEVSFGGERPNSKKAIQRAGAELATGPGTYSFGGAVDTGVDYERLGVEHPTERYKFYHSFGNSEAAETYLTDVIRKALERGISMSMKSFDHTYDGINIYTYHFKEMNEIIAETYAEHPDAWLNTEHFLQGEVPGVNPNHIGWVQEPAGIAGQHSHSGRMGILGEALDVGGLTEESYRQGCATAGVRPDTPWLLDADYEEQLKATASQSLHR